mgnify:CR=1 FL=1
MNGVHKTLISGREYIVLYRYLNAVIMITILFSLIHITQKDIISPSSISSVRLIGGSSQAPEELSAVYLVLDVYFYICRREICRSFVPMSFAFFVTYFSTEGRVGSGK